MPGLLSETDILDAHRRKRLTMATFATVSLAPLFLEHENFSLSAMLDDLGVEEEMIRFDDFGS